MKRTWSATILSGALVSNRPSTGIRGPRACQESIAHSITPPPPTWTVGTWHEGLMIYATNSDHSTRNLDSPDLDLSEHFKWHHFCSLFCPLESHLSVFLNNCTRTGHLLLQPRKQHVHSDKLVVAPTSFSGAVCLTTHHLLSGTILWPLSSPSGLRPQNPLMAGSSF